MCIRDLLFYKGSLYVPSYLFWCQKIWENVLLLLLRHSNKGRFTKNLPPTIYKSSVSPPPHEMKIMVDTANSILSAFFLRILITFQVFLKLKKMASKIFLIQSFKNIYHLLICFINEIINDAAPAIIDRPSLPS